jgi:4-hydroxythreonine-4-phosphate dehydrogenase
MKKFDLVITPGDPQGIGPEVTAKALIKLSSRLRGHTIVIAGSSEPFQAWESKLKKYKIEFFEPPRRSTPGYQSGWSIEVATQFVLAAPASRALVTGPVHKERLQSGGYQFRGHTDFLAHLTDTQSVTMMLANELFRVCLVTNHCPLSEVSARITPKSLETTFLHARDYAIHLLGKRKPKIAFLGLNPHSGENGILGFEEKTILSPTLSRLKAKYKETSISGPHPADSFFAIEKSRKSKDRSDVIIAMYHDQGLIPVKLSNFSESMNMTLGLPIIRTSVDHGTAFDIAGKNTADPGSMIYAIERALNYLEVRNKK